MWNMVYFHGEKKMLAIKWFYLGNTIIPSSDDFTTANDEFKWFATSSWWIEHGAIIQCTSIMNNDSLASLWETASYWHNFNKIKSKSIKCNKQIWKQINVWTYLINNTRVINNHSNICNEISDWILLNILLILLIDWN